MVEAQRIVVVDSDLKTKDTVRLPLGQPIPYDLIERVVALLVMKRVERGE